MFVGAFMRTFVVVALLVASCSEAPVAAPPDITRLSIEEAVPRLVGDVCMENLGSRRAIARAAKAGAWEPVEEQVVRAWEDWGIPSTHRKIWRARGGEAPIYVETGAIGGGPGTWYCRIAFVGGAPDAISRKFDAMRDGLAEIRQPNLPKAGWTNLGYFSSASEKEWSALNFSFVDTEDATPLRVVEITAQADGTVLLNVEVPSISFESGG